MVAKLKRTHLSRNFGTIVIFLNNFLNKNITSQEQENCTITLNYILIYFCRLSHGISKFKQYRMYERVVDRKKTEL